AIPMLSLRNSADEAPAVALTTHLQSALLWLGSPSTALATLPGARRLLRIELPVADATRTRTALVARWRRPASASTQGSDMIAALERAASQFHLGPSALDDVVETLDAVEPSMRVDAVWSAAREAARGGLNALAQHIVTRVTFDDLVLPPAHLAALRDIARQ